MRLSSEVYKTLKWTSLIALPALGTLYLTLAMIWHLPFGDEISKTCQAAALCIGALIGISTIQYNKDKEKEENKIE